MNCAIHLDAVLRVRDRHPRRVEDLRPQHAVRHLRRALGPLRRRLLDGGAPQERRLQRPRPLLQVLRRHLLLGLLRQGHRALERHEEAELKPTEISSSQLLPIFLSWHYA